MIYGNLFYSILTILVSYFILLLELISEILNNLQNLPIDLTFNLIINSKS